MNSSKLTIFLLLFGLSLYGHSQADFDPTNRHPYLGLTVGLAHVKVKDQLVMPVRYAGTNIAFGFNYLKRKPKSLQEVFLDAVIGSIKTRDANIDNFGARFQEPRAQLYRGDLGYSWVHTVPSLSNDKYQTYMGASAYLFWNVRFSERWDNSAINYEGALTPLSWLGRVERSIITKKKEKKLTFSYSLNIPLLAIVSRPEFSGVPDFLDHETPFLTDLFERARWVSFWEFPRIKSTLDLTMPLSSSNLMRFSYRWDYYSYQEPVTTQAASHSFLFTLLTHL